MNVLTEKADLSLKYTAHYNEIKDELQQESSAVMNAPRQQAIRDFVAQGIPTRRVENYKYTNLQPSFVPDYEFFHQPPAVEGDISSAFRCGVPKLDTTLAFVSNGWFDHQNSRISELPQGVILDSIENTARRNPAMLSRYATLAPASDDPMVALNTMFARDGFFLYIPKNMVVDKPIQLINLLHSLKDGYVTQRNFIFIEEGADVKLIQCDHTLNLNSYLYNSTTEIFVGANASFEHYTLQNQHNKATSINSVYITQERDSKVSALYATLHGGLIRNNLKIILNGENAEANLYGMSFIDRKQHVDNFTQVIHAKPHCLSNQLYKNVLDDESSGAFSGRIHVVRDAQKTNAFQRNNNLLLTDKATMQTKPQLIIDADDVKCSHGATIGQIDEEALFYIRARGIDEKKARLMMMNAFTHEVIQQIKSEPLRSHIDDLVDKRLRGEVARCHDCAYNC